MPSNVRRPKSAKRALLGRTMKHSGRRRGDQALGKAGQEALQEAYGASPTTPTSTAPSPVPKASPSLSFQAPSEPAMSPLPSDAPAPL